MRAAAVATHASWPAPSLALSAAVLERDVLAGVSSTAYVGGFVDAAGFMARAGLFASHVTGRFVLIGEQRATGTDGGGTLLAADDLRAGECRRRRHLARHEG
ncbi:DUF1275 family protein [Ancylobacter sp. WKF20]|uniref:DUF1275 family protein n=1 Tax=Ancylobacter sp. WKF20 TaxID=3039801 RepID=UPI00325FCC63